MINHNYGLHSCHINYQLSTPESAIELIEVCFNWWFNGEVSADFPQYVVSSCLGYEINKTILYCHNYWTILIAMKTVSASFFPPTKRNYNDEGAHARALHMSWDNKMRLNQSDQYNALINLLISRVSAFPLKLKTNNPDNVKHVWSTVL